MNSTKLLRVVLITTAIFTCLALGRVVWVMKIESIPAFQLKWTILVVSLALFAAVFFVLSWRAIALKRLLDNIGDRVPSTPVVKAISLVLFFLLLALFSWIVLFSPLRGFLTGNVHSAATWYQGELYLTDVDAGQTAVKSVSGLNSTAFQWWIFWICGLTAASAMKLGKKDVHFGIALISAFIGEAVLYKLASALVLLSPSPFAMTSQEGYRLYYASLLVSQRLYGIKVPLSLVDFSLNLLNGVPFLLGKFPILAHRLWQLFLSFGLTTLTGWALARRLKVRGRLLSLLITLGLVLYFLSEVGIKYSLMVCVLIVLLGFSSRHRIWTLVSIIAASFWAGLSRPNWFPVPAMLGIALYLLEEPVQQFRTIKNYLVWPILWAVTGISAALIANAMLPFLSGTSPYMVGSILKSSYLWYRLLPNPTYSLGILPAAIGISLPLWWICWRARGRWHLIRTFGLLSMIFMLFLIGLVASVKIGGGGDLHNLDAYLVLLGIVSTYLFFQKDVPDGNVKPISFSWLAIVLVLAFPVWSATRTVYPYFPYDRAATEDALQALREKTEEASARGEVLFMYQKQLLSFGYIHVPLVAGYENVYLMEMAMSQNVTYLERFYEDLCQQRFSLIVAEGQPKGLQGKSHSFGEENDAWFTAVTQPLLKAYQFSGRIPEAGVELYIPRSDMEKCGEGSP